MSQKQTIKILISSAGRRVELMACFRSAASEMDLGCRVVATDMNPSMSPACLAADAAFEVPPSRSEGFIERTMEICEREGIDLVIPTIDPELLLFSRALSEFNRRGTLVAVADERIVRMARNKLETAHFLAACGVPAPETYMLEDYVTRTEERRLPVIVKPIDGSCSKGIKILRTLEEVRAVSVDRQSQIVQDYWEGKEYTVNCFFDSKGDLRVAVPHLRYEIRAGEVSKGITEKHEGLMEVANRLGNHIEGAFGGICFQAIVRPDGKLVVFEINARFGGGYPLADYAGAKCAKALISEALEIPMDIDFQWRSGVKMLRYDAAVFGEIE
jgi:carbamoyl-phosphate synthase large subunit